MSEVEHKEHKEGHIRDKFILFFVILASVPVLILGGISLYFIQGSHKYDVSALELQLIGQKTEEIDKFLLDTVGALEINLGISETLDVESSQLPWQQVLADKIIENNSSFEEVSFIDLQGKERAKKIRQEVSELVNVSLLPKFKEAMGGKKYVSEVYYTLSGPMVTVAAPLKYENRVVQIVSAEVNLSKINKSIETARLGRDGYLILLDTTGSIIGQGGLDNLKPGFDLGRSARVKRLIGGEMFDGLGEKDRYYSLLGGEAVVGAGKKIEATGWILMAEWPIRDADKIVLSTRSNVIRLTLFSILGVIVFAFFFSSKLVKPIRALEAGTLEIEKGNFEKRVEITTRDEIEALGHAFNKMAQGLKRLQELKNEFVFIAAHELRTPLTAIKGFLSLLKDEKGNVLTERSGEYIARSLGASDRLAKLVNEILEIARSEAGRIKIEVSPQDLVESIKTILAEVKTIADQKKISLSYDELPELPKVLADPAKLKEVVTNFISNAVKYNNEGGWVKVYHEVNDKEVITHFEDNGFGISEKEQKQLFQKFFRADIGRLKSIEGTGLGLFITKELVEKMEGRVWFKSQEGKGTTFSFSLKRVL
ncbi:MAG: sensor histidine kinase [Candidatus Taylorbacteria bacterium]|nr:sensor histidine kinase [Candidatus Taylorbacteria bacterium]